MQLPGLVSISIRLVAINNIVTSTTSKQINSAFPAVNSRITYYNSARDVNLGGTHDSFGE